MLSVNDRIALTIAEIEYSDAYDDNMELFNKGVTMLKSKINNKSFKEFDDAETDLLCEIYSIMECYNDRN